MKGFRFRKLKNPIKWSRGPASTSQPGQAETSKLGHPPEIGPDPIVHATAIKAEEIAASAEPREEAEQPEEVLTELDTEGT